MCDCQNNKYLTGLAPVVKCDIYRTTFGSVAIPAVLIGGPLLIAGITYLTSKPKNKKHNTKKYGLIGSGALIAAYASYYWLGRNSCEFNG